MKRATLAALTVLSFLALPATAVDGPFTTKNDDSCDIMVAPAATLLLPYFEVDPLAPTGETTLLTVSNVTPLPQIAHVTIWTDWSFPVLAFDIFLTGYDAQSINLYDVLVRGRIAEPGTSSDSDAGPRSRQNDGNPLLDVSNCDRLPVVIPREVLTDTIVALTTGQIQRCEEIGRVGGRHANAAGYVTIDVVASCGASFPTDAGYATTRLLYDNVLSGDYEQVDSGNNFAQGGPMVHIRAFPEGGAPGAKPTHLARTFYGNYQDGGTADRRQPLPATFATRWIAGGPTLFETSYKIWREGVAPSGSECNVTLNNQIRLTELVRFDEDENPTTSVFECPILCPVVDVTLPAASRITEGDPIFPPNPGGAVAGWMYMNLDNGTVQTPVDVASQNWVITSMRAEGRYSTDFDAALLGNGCSAAAALTGEDGSAPGIGPAANGNKTFASGSPATLNNDDSCDIMVAPAATLLLPYFEVDLDNPNGETTLLKIWREGVSGSAGCAVSDNSRIDLVEFVRFDELENPTVAAEGLEIPPISQRLRLPTTVRLSANDTTFLPPIYDDQTVAGWMYVNLDSVEAPQSAASQSWVVVSMSAESRYSVDFDALALGNGCSPAVGLTDQEGGSPAIGPAGNP